MLPTSLPVWSGIPFIDEKVETIPVVVTDGNGDLAHIDGVSGDGLDVVQGNDKGTVYSHKALDREDFLKVF